MDQQTVKDARRIFWALGIRVGHVGDGLLKPSMAADNFVRLTFC